MSAKIAVILTILVMLSIGMAIFILKDYVTFGNPAVQEELAEANVGNASETTTKAVGSTVAGTTAAPATTTATTIANTTESTTATTTATTTTTTTTTTSTKKYEGPPIVIMPQTTYGTFSEITTGTLHSVIEPPIIIVETIPPIMLPQ